MYNPHEKKFTQFTVKSPCELLPFIQQCLDGISRNKAKAILINKKGLSEAEAHKAIGKLAMDNGVSRGEIAKRIIG